MKRNEPHFNMIKATEFFKKKSHIQLLAITAASGLFLTGCITSSRQDQMQTSLSQLQGQIAQLQEQMNKRDQQISNTTQTALSSQSDLESLQTQLQLTQGSVDELKAKIKRIEENSGGSSSEQNVISLNAPSDALTQIQRQIARIEIAASSKVGINRKNKLPPKMNSLADITKSLKSAFDQGNYKQTLELSNTVIHAIETTDDMMQLALEYRAESKFKLRDYKGAAIDLSNYIELFPNTNKYPLALLLAGDSYVYLKNNSMAKSYYQECAKSYSNLAEGKAAAGRLAKLTTQTASSQAQSK
jgi:outer membrane murein-binding lipoprotein Lpp